MKELNFEKTMLSNGAPLYVMHMPQALTQATGVLIKAGTRDEIWPKEAGLAHALEHMILHGTTRFPTEKDLSAYIEDIGGVINAWTWSESTFFWNRVPIAHAERSFVANAEEICSPLIPENMIGTEMLNIVEEIRMHRDNPQSYVGDLATQFLYQQHPLSKLTLGTEESVKSFTRDNFLEFMKRLYVSSNMTLVAAGGLSLEEVRLQFEKVFSQNIEGVHNRRESEVLSVNEKREAVFKKDIDQVNIILTAAIGKSDEKSSKAIDLFTTMLSGGMSFPLFQEVRTKRGLCYDISAGAVRFSDVGNFSIYIGTDPGRYREAIGAAMGVISSSKEDKELLERAKQVELGRLALACENTGSVINMAASQIFQVGRPLGYKELEEEIKDIKISDISSAVDQYLKPENIRQVLLVPKNLEIK